jgi:RNA polymerase sigma-70 factor (ECF subfamily)
MALNEEPQANPSAGSELDPSDRSLLRRYRDGSEDAAREIYRRYAQRLRALAQAKCAHDLASRLDIEDIVQSVFGSFFRGANRGYYEVPAGEELWKLLLVIALNKIRAKGAFHRAAKRDVRLTASQETLEQAGEFLAGDDVADQAFLQLTIDEALERLPVQHRQMVVLRLEGYEVAEMSRKTGRSKRTVERILQESRKKLSDLLGTEN